MGRRKREGAMMRLGSLVLLGALASPLALSPASAQTVEQFYKDKTITLLVGSGSGGSYEIYARALARHMSRHIPGNPAIIVKIGGGGGGGLATSIQLHHSVPKDGTVIGMTQQTNIVSQLIEPAVAGKYDVAQWHWIGLMAPVRNMLAVWHTAPAQTIEEAKLKEVVIGATGRASPTFVVPQVMNEILGTKFKIVLGYKGVQDLNLAMERGEIQGRGASWISVVTQAPAYIAEKKLKALVVEGLTPEPSIPDVPLMVSFAKTDRERDALRLMAAAAEFGRAVFAPPGTPADRVEALRRAFDATVKDQAFLEEAKKAKLVIEPQTGAALVRIARQVIASSPDAIAYARQLMKGK
jgi:tripartite-type tricarboxylate transporter receptor subunit TctC